MKKKDFFFSEMASYIVVGKKSSGKTNAKNMPIIVDDCKLPFDFHRDDKWKDVFSGLHSSLPIPPVTVQSFRTPPLWMRRDQNDDPSKTLETR